jgi:hypothetical protein
MAQMADISNLLIIGDISGWKKILNYIIRLVKRSRDFDFRFFWKAIDAIQINVYKFWMIKNSDSIVRSIRKLSIRKLFVGNKFLIHHTSYFLYKFILGVKNKSFLESCIWNNAHILFSHKLMKGISKYICFFSC